MASPACSMLTFRLGVTATFTAISPRLPSRSTIDDRRLSTALKMEICASQARRPRHPNSNRRIGSTRPPAHKQ